MIRRFSLSDFNRLKSLWKGDPFPIFFEQGWLTRTLDSGYLSFANRGFYLTYWQNNQLLAVFPITYRKLFFKLIMMPYLTPYLGCVFKDAEEPGSHRLEKHGKIFGEFLDYLAAQNYFWIFYSFDPEFMNLQEAIWRNLHVELRYTYLHSHPENVTSTLAADLKSDLRFAEKSGIVTEISLVWEEFLDLWEATLSRQNVRRIGKGVFKSLICWLFREDRAFLCLSRNEELQSGCLILRDNGKYYYLAGADRRKIRGSGTRSLMLALQHAASQSASFDFEGSMIPGIAHYFRKFGGELIPYYSLMHPLIKILLYLKRYISVSGKNM
ncbi:MAG: hypothetical protein PHW04_07125 [Candidatus Wallbacteria bacterium]|nr:hypothetical protein [Candidatus Wallbacteria bacterium]